MQSSDLDKIISEVINDSDTYSQYYLSKYGISQPSMSQFRNGKRRYKNIRLKTVLQMLDAYNDKQKKN